ncbi:MAG: zinc-binding dehydrogenase [Nitrososphaerota archaeon]|nr:zinc-binding dehydrogenase [Candidatus Calditenuaceae archaeon]MDW8073824.1 zinc-binding dehydrogenase [Nitrososphaerota archaeon]
MKAVVLERYGPPEVLEYRDVVDPVPAEGEALVKVAAAGVNRVDVWIRTGKYQVKLPHVLGVDVAGEVLSSTVPQFKRGDRVVVFPDMPCGRCKQCLTGRFMLCRNSSRLGSTRWGGYAELVTAPAATLVPVPGDVSLEEAAALPVNYTTAWHALITDTGVGPGMRVLVVGASSGVGVAATQIASLSGAEVIAMVGDEWKVEKAYKAGASLVVNRTKKDVVEEVMKATDGEGVDVVLEMAGAAFWEKALQCLAPGGTLVTVGATVGDQVSFNVRPFFRKYQKIIGSGVGTQAEFLKIIDLVSKGRLRPFIDKVFSLKEASEAHKRLEAGEHFGKILLKP